MMKANVLKYIGEFSGAEAKNVQFPKDVPVLITDTVLFDSLKDQSDFVQSSLAELEEYGAKGIAPKRSARKSATVAESGTETPATGQSAEKE